MWFAFVHSTNFKTDVTKHTYLINILKKGGGVANADINSKLSVIT